MSEEVDLSRHQLPAEVNERILREEIVPDHMTGVQPRPEPVVVFVGGQPGAGKTATAGRVKAALHGRGGAAHVCGDFYKPYHPDYAALLEADDRTAGAYTRRDTRDWHAKAEAYARDRRFDAVVETAMADPDEFGATAQRFRTSGYRIEVVTLAVPAALSRLGILDRYTRQRQVDGKGRWVNQANHDGCYHGMAATAERIDQDHLADAVVVIRRGNQVLYGNYLDGTGRWAEPAMSRPALEVERARPWTHEETAAFRTRIAGLADLLGPQWRDELAAITRLTPAPLRTTGWTITPSW